MKHILIILTTLMLTACGLNQVEYRIENKPVYPPTSLTVVYPVPPPIDPFVYSELTFDQKEDFLMNYIFDLLSLISKDRVDKEGLNKWSKEIQNKISDKGQLQ